MCISATCRHGTAARDRPGHRIDGEDPSPRPDRAGDAAGLDRRGFLRGGAALVAMYSGWDEGVDDADTFRGGGGFPDLNFPGFSVDATDWLVARRDPVGIGVDTMSLDPGNSADFAVHFGFLATDRYGVENLRNLGQVPAKGTTVFVGAVPWEDGSGGPCRVLATR